MTTLARIGRSAADLSRDLVSIDGLDMTAGKTEQRRIPAKWRQRRAQESSIGHSFRDRWRETTSEETTDAHLEEIECIETSRCLYASEKQSSTRELKTTAAHRLDLLARHIEVPLQTRHTATTQHDEPDIEPPDFHCPFYACHAHVQLGNQYVRDSDGRTIALACVHQGCEEAFTEAEQWRAHVMDAHHDLLQT